MTIDNLNTSLSYKDLESNGYLLIPSFLSPAEIEMFENDIAVRNIAYAQKKLKNDNYRWIENPSKEVFEKFIDKFTSVYSTVAQQTNIKADLLLGGTYFSTQGGQSFGWHQDHESYYFYQNHYHYLNLYIPIIKPEISKSNLCIIPFDRLKARNPDIYQKVLGKGAVYYKVENNITIIYNENDGGEYGRLDYSIDDIAETPQLKSGDLLLLRGDVIHRTEDATTLRTALSVRIASTQKKISKIELVDGGLKKFQMMLNGRALYQILLSYFDEMKVNELSLTDWEKFHEFSKTFSEEQIMSRSQFSKYLLLQKIRMGLFYNTAIVLSHFLGAHFNKFVMKLGIK